MTRTENENSEVSATVREERKMEMEQRNPARTLFIKFREALVMLSDTNKARKSGGGHWEFWFIFELRSAWGVSI